MAGVIKVHGFTTPAQFIGRDIFGINVSGMAACPALFDGELVKWDDLETAVQAIETICTISVVGDFTAGDTELNMIVEGLNAEDLAGEYAKLSTASGSSS